jgi:hypothetical protein
LGQGPEETVGWMVSQGTFYIKNRLQYTLELNIIKVAILPYHICIFVQPQECKNYLNSALAALNFSQTGSSSATIF